MRNRTGKTIQLIQDQNGKNTLIVTILKGDYYDRYEKS